MVVPAIFSGTVFATWLSLLWSSYELAAQPSSSLLAGTVSPVVCGLRCEAHALLRAGTNDDVPDYPLDYAHRQACLRPRVRAERSPDSRCRY